ncbi:hypothetical protein ScPMuIL_018972 [Solemya velum]
MVLRAARFQIYFSRSLLPILIVCLWRTCHAKTDYVLRDRRQAEFVRNLASYDVAIPSVVASDGSHLSQYSPSTLLPAETTRYNRWTNIFTNISDARFEKSTSTGCHLIGHVIGQENSSRVAIGACGGLRGMVHTNDTEYFIEPVNGHDVDKDPQHPHLIYRRSALPLSLDIAHSIQERSANEGSCGVAGSSHENAFKEREKWEKQNRKENHHRRKRSISTDKIAETLVLVDPQMVNIIKTKDIEN